MNSHARGSLNAQPPHDSSDRQRGELAAGLVPIAANLAWRVRDEGRESVGELLASLSPRQRWALPVVLAAMVDVDKRPDELLAWVTFDEYGQSLPHARPSAPQQPPSRGEAAANRDGRASA